MEETQEEVRTIEDMMRTYRNKKQVHTLGEDGKPVCGTRRYSIYGAHYGRPYEVTCLKCYYIARNGNLQGWAHWYSTKKKEEKIYEMECWYDRLLKKSNSRGRYDQYVYDKEVQKEHKLKRKMRLELEKLDEEAGLKRFNQWATRQKEIEEQKANRKSN